MLSASAFFRQELAEELGGAPAISLEGIVSAESTGRRAAGVQVWGVDERFWRFHSREAHNGVFASRALTAELGVNAGDAIHLSFEKPSAIPVESLHGRREEAVRGLRLTLAGTLSASQLGEFTLRPQQGAVRCLFVPLEVLTRQLERNGTANVALLRAAVPPGTLREKLRLEDLGVRLRPLKREFAVESEGTMLSDSLAEAVVSAASKTGARTVPVYTYLANTIRSGEKSIPYSLIAAVGDAGVSRDGIALNEWAARELRARPGDPIEFEYFIWSENGRLETQSATFRVQRVLPMGGLGADRALAPEYPGITDSDSLSDWDPPFPIDLARIRPADEEYWRRYRTSPKAIIALERGQELWATRFGKLTSIRIERVDREEFRHALRAAIDPTRAGLVVEDVRRRSLEAAAGATDFGEYFTYFSFFLVIAALLLAGLFFRFGVEGRVREIGTLRAVGFSQAAVRRILLTEAASVAVIGGGLGVAGAMVYAALIVWGLGTWWVDAVGTTLLSVHVSPAPLVYGMVGGVGAGIVFLLVTLRSLRRSSPRALLAGVSGRAEAPRSGTGRMVWAGAAALMAAALLVTAALGGMIAQAGAFFAAGGLLLAGALCLFWAWLVRPGHRTVATLGTLGLRYAAHAPGRSALTVALIGFASFVIVAVDSFRVHDQGGTPGGFSLIGESVLPVYHDLNTPEGREQFNLPEHAEILAFRVRSGDDASCLNLYRPQNPKIAAPPRRLIAENSWQVLDSPIRDGAIPAIVDANSLRYVFHLNVGDVIEIPGGVRLRFVAALRDSVFQSEVIISPENFVRAFPREEGFRLFLIRAADEGRAAAALEEALADYGLDAVPIAERLAQYQRVENTYLSTFQALGGLGLLLGTVGLGAVLLRNVMERRRETALLRAVGYTAANLRYVLLAEALLLLVAGLAAGTFAALVAIAPAIIERGGSAPFVSLGALLGAVLVTGLAASLAALRLAMRSPLLAALRSE